MKARWSISNLSKEERDVVIRAAKSVYLEEQKKQVRWMWAVVLWHLHEKLGWGEMRINRMLAELLDEWRKADERYELDEKMRYGDLCIMWLEKIGVDIEKVWEMFEG